MIRPLSRVMEMRAKSLCGPPAAGSMMMYTCCFHWGGGGVMLITASMSAVRKHCWSESNANPYNQNKMLVLSYACH